MLLLSIISFVVATWVHASSVYRDKQALSHFRSSMHSGSSGADSMSWWSEFDARSSGNRALPQTHNAICGVYSLSFKPHFSNCICVRFPSSCFVQPFLSNRPTSLMQGSQPETKIAKEKKRPQLHRHAGSMSADTFSLQRLTRLSSQTWPSTSRNQSITSLLCLPPSTLLEARRIFKC